VTLEVLSLEEHVERLLAFCERVAAPLPGWREIRVLDTSDPRVTYRAGWVASESALRSVSEFSPRFNSLLMTGYAWINLSAYGMFGLHLILGVDVPRHAQGVPTGLTSVNYSGPPLSGDGKPSWNLKLTLLPNL
jgi:hypothetical protein